MELSKEDKMINEQDEKVEKLLDKILPLMIIFRMCDQIVNKIHAKVTKEGAPTKGLSKAAFLDLDNYISAKYDEVILACESITNSYKTEILLMKSFEDFLVGCNMMDIVNNEFKGVDTFVKHFVV